MAAEAIRSLERDLSLKDQKIAELERERDDYLALYRDVSLDRNRLGDRAESLQSQLAAAQGDAERYRFLRDNPNFQIEYTGALTLDAAVLDAQGDPS